MLHAPNRISFFRTRFGTGLSENTAYVLKPDFISEPGHLQALCDELRGCKRRTHYETPRQPYESVSYGERFQLEGYVPLKTHQGLLVTDISQPIRQKSIYRMSTRRTPTVKTTQGKTAVGALVNEFTRLVQSHFPDIYEKMLAAKFPLVDFVLFRYIIPPGEKYPGLTGHQDGEFVNSDILVNPDLNIHGGELYLQDIKPPHHTILETNAFNTMVAFRDQQDQPGLTFNHPKHGVREGLNQTDQPQERMVAVLAVNKKTCGLEPLED